MTLKQFYLTQEGLKKIKKELDELKNVRRKEISERIGRAKELGDLSENAEYHDAKDEQGMIEGRILELTNILNNAIISNGKKDGVVGLGSIVKVKSNDEEKEFTVVGFNEADPSIGKISNESPLGKAFLNRRAGDRVTVTTPKGELKYSILEIK